MNLPALAPLALCDLYSWKTPESAEATFARGWVFAPPAGDGVAARSTLPSKASVTGDRAPRTESLCIRTPRLNFKNATGIAPPCSQRVCATRSPAETARVSRDPQDQYVTEPCWIARNGSAP